MSIVYMALENIVGGMGVQRRWMITSGSVSFTISASRLPSADDAISPARSADVAAVVQCRRRARTTPGAGLLIPTLEALFRFAVAERIGTIILSADRGPHGLALDDRARDRLSQFRFQWPALNPALLASAMRWLMVLVFLAGLLWFVRSAGLCDSHS